MFLMPRIVIFLIRISTSFLMRNGTGYVVCIATLLLTTTWSLSVVASTTAVIASTNVLKVDTDKAPFGLAQMFGEKVDYLYERLPQVKELHAVERNAYRSAIAEVLDSELDLRRITRGIMGSYFKGATSKQRRAFYSKLRSDFIDYCAAGLIKVDFKGLTKPKIVAVDDKDKNSVKLEVRTRSGRTVPVLVSLSRKKKENHYRIVNIVVAGINVGVMLRHQFTASYLLSGGNIDKVISEWSPISL